MAVIGFGYNPKVFPVVAPSGWKATERAVKSNGASCNNDAGKTYTSGGQTYPAERPILWDGYEATRTDIDGEAVPHHAIDIMAAMGAPIVADQSGTVFTTWTYNGQKLPGVGTSSRGGNYVWISGDDGVDRYYAHLRDMSQLTPGQKVAVGDLVGYVGDTGNAKGGCPHLHYAVTQNGQKFNPYDKLKVLYDQGAWQYTPNGWGASFFSDLIVAAVGASIGAGIAYFLLKKKYVS